ncbi:MAG: PQQ-binding-like beta-propeller repeat protein [Candidatus Brocadiia bacterium]
MRTRRRIRRLGGLATGWLVTAWLCAVVAAPAQAGEPDAEAGAKAILEATGVQGGLVVHLGCGDGRLTAALRATDAYLVHGLEADPAKVDAARQHIRSRGLYGPVSVAPWTGRRLPYAEELVNLVVAEDPRAVPSEELMRVLCPGGVAYVKAGEGWTKTVKPRPDDIDEWTHYLHDPTNNAVAADRRVGPPRHMRWVGSPKWARSHDHLASISVVVSSGGRVFYIADEGPVASVALPSDWKLVARDAFSGVVLWKRAVGPWEGRLRNFRSGPPSLHRRLVAVGDRVYATRGYGKPLCVLDAATGETLRTYEGTGGTTEVVYRDGILTLVLGQREAEAVAEAARRGEPVPAPHRKRILVLDAETGETLWKKADADTAELMPTTLAVGTDRLCFQNTEAVLCLDARSGEELWRARRLAQLRRLGWSTPTLVIRGDVVLSADRQARSKPAEGPQEVEWVPSRRGGNAPPGQLVAYSMKDGAELWRCPCREAYNAPVDVLVADGLVWTGNLVRANEPGITQGRDPLTGEVRRERPPDQRFFRVGMGHHRCHRNKATERYLVLGRSGVEFIDVATGKGIANHWVRGTCQYGVMPCNGLLYAPPHSCACHIRGKLSGFNALAADRPEAHQAPSHRLVRGPAFGEVGEVPAAQPDQWPTYRHDAGRSGATPAAVPAEAKPAWQARVGGRLTSPVVAGGLVLVASIDAHTVHALDARTGEARWTFTAGGRVDSPPTLWRGHAVFGSADGWVYCLRAADGELAWRFRAAPEERRVVSYGQLESAWPVPGSVLVHEGVAYFAAGRSSFLDGGMVLHRVEVATGKALSRTPIDSRDPETGEEPQEMIRGTFMAGGALPDVLSCDGRSVFLRYKRFDLEGGEQSPDVPHLYSPAGFLDGSWWHRTYWFIGTQMGAGWGGWPRVGSRVPSGRILAVDEETIYGYGRNRYTTQGSHAGLRGVHYRLFAAARKARGGKAQYRWQQRVPIVVRAMVLAGDTLFLAGPPDLFEGLDAEAVAALEGQKGAALWAVDASEGRKLAQLALDSPPVFDGMAAAPGRLVVATCAGRVVCLAGQ